MATELKVGEALIKVVKGDITKLEVEAVVNPANSLMLMGGGVAGALKRVGGKVIEDEARKYAPVPVGEAVVTTAGKLPCKYVIHAPTMERPAMRTTVEKVRAAVKAALRAASEKGIEEVAFPGMGTGVGGVPPKEAAKAMIEEIVNHMRTHEKPKKVVLVAYDDELYRAFTEALSKTKVE